MLTAEKINIIKDAMIVAANKLPQHLPEQQLLRFGVAMIGRMQLADNTADAIKIEEQKGPTALFVTLSSEWVEHLDSIHEYYEDMQRQMRAVNARAGMAVVA